jgi:hypothetical protein
MASPRKFTVTYMDDREPEVVNVPIGCLVLMERKWPQGAPLIEAMLFGVFIAKGNKADDEAGFDAFCMEIAEVEPGEVEPSDPTRPAATDA